MQEFSLPAFQGFRKVPWNPQFFWVNDVPTVADKINLPHEDYPNRVKRTINAIYRMESLTNLTLEHLLKIHRIIFDDQPFGGYLRECNVQVGFHRPPNYQLVEKLMNQLIIAYQDRLDSIDNLKAWYNDFETIHPFQDGNGRVGGVILAVISHNIQKELSSVGKIALAGYLAPSQ